MYDTQISFVITSKRDSIFINQAINAINNVCDKNYEIIFTSERSYTDIDPSAKYIHTKFYTSVENYNEGYRHASYDWICLLTDDIHLAKDPRYWFKELPKDYPQSHIFNIHKENYIHSIIRNDKHLSAFRYPVIYIPCLHRRIIEEEFAGRILSEAFKHHYVDHWTGMFLKLQYPDFELVNFQCTRDAELFTDMTHNEHDKAVYDKAVHHIKQSNKYYGYNGLFNLSL